MVKKPFELINRLSNDICLVVYDLNFFFKIRCLNILILSIIIIIYIQTKRKVSDENKFNNKSTRKKTNNKREKIIFIYEKF